MNSATHLESQSAFFRWAWRLSTLAFAGQIIVLLLAGGVLLASFIPLLQPWVSTRYTDASSLMLLQIVILVLYFPLALTKEVRSQGSAGSWRDLLAHFPPVSCILLALGIGVELFNFWFIPQWPRDLLASATTPEAQAAFLAENNLHSVRVAALTTLSLNLIYMGLGYQCRWLAARRARGNTAPGIDSGVESSPPGASYR
jgi:small-conductance mechanosensitive channel